MNKPPLQILLVEDNPDDARRIMEILKTAGRPCRIQVATDRSQAMAQLRQPAPPPDLVLLDLNLHERNGREVLAEIKSNDRLKRVPVVMVSGSARQADILQAYQLKANCCVTKPSTPEAFMDVIRGVKEFWLSTVSLPEH